MLDDYQFDQEPSNNSQVTRRQFKKSKKSASNLSKVESN
jgi:hypothetical protein